MTIEIYNDQNGYGVTQQIVESPREEFVLKKKYLLLLAAAGLIAATAMVGTFASGYVESGTVLQNISEKSLGISVLSGDTKNNGSTTSEIKVVPGGTTSLDYRVLNDRKGGYDLYTRVTVHYGWSKDTLVDAEAKKSHVVLKMNGKAYPLVKSYENQIKIGDWIVAYCDSEEAVLYYSKPLAYGETASFLDEITFDTDMGNQYADAHFLLDIDAAAVQADNSDDAIAAEWGVFPHFEKEILMSVSETRS